MAPCGYQAIRLGPAKLAAKSPSDRNFESFTLHDIRKKRYCMIWVVFGISSDADDSLGKVRNLLR